MACSLTLLGAEGANFESLFPVPVGLPTIIARRCGGLAAGPRLRLPLGEIGAERLVQPVAAGFGCALAFGRPAALVMAKTIPVTFAGKCWGKLASALPLWQGPRATVRLQFLPPCAYLTGTFAAVAQW